jgi:hypothetical protein
MHNRHKRVCTVYRRGLSKPVVDMQRRTETRTLKKRPQRKTGAGSIFGKWPTRKGLILTFFARSPPLPATPAALLTVSGSQKAFHPRIPVSSYVAMPTNGPAWTFTTQALKLTRSHLDQGRSRASPLATDAKSQPMECTEDDYRSFCPFPALCR